MTSPDGPQCPAADDMLDESYQRTVVGGETWLYPAEPQSLDDFQRIVAAAEALESVNLIDIVELHEETHTGRLLVHAVKFRRLK